MAGTPSPKGQSIALDAITGRATQTARTVYLGLLTAAPSASPTLANITELSTAGYSRQACAFSAPTGSNPTTIANSALITFGPLTAGSPGTSTHGFLTDASSGTSGDVLFTWTLDVAQTPGQNGSITVPAGNLTSTAA